jgi:membrane peptidoglycan carboxypeptidase
MTAGGPAGDGGYAEVPATPTVPLGWGAPGGNGPHTQPLPGIPHTPTSPGMPRATRPHAPHAPARPRAARPGAMRPTGPRGGRAEAPRLPRWLRRVLTMVLALALAGLLAFVTLFLATPSVSNALSLAQAYDRAHGAPYPGPPVPERFTAALVSTEDHRFYSEPGFDPIAIGRVVVGRVSGQPDQGGATLYQQLAKMLYTPGQSGVGVEAKQIMLGIKLDLSYSKAQILRLYSGVTYFGNGYYGLAEASCGYFGVTPARLSWAQAALLAGLVQAPSADSPIGHYAVARAREAHVLGRLVATGALTQAQAARAYGAPLHLVGGPAHGCTAR